MDWLRHKLTRGSGSMGGGGSRRGGEGDGNQGGVGAGGSGRRNHDRGDAHPEQRRTSYEPRRTILRRIAEETVQAMQDGLYTHEGVDYMLRQRIADMVNHTSYFSPNSPIKHWTIADAIDGDNSGPVNARISILNVSALDAARLLRLTFQNTEGGANGVPMCKIGVLNFASATKPGGDFLAGAGGQEESIARSSTLSASLMKSDEACKFYRMHGEFASADNDVVFYSHGIIYSPDVVVFRDNEGGWSYPMNVDVLSCAEVSAREVLNSTGSAGALGMEFRIKEVMLERMGRVLFVFEQHGVRNIVLGTFGPGVFQKEAIAAWIWARLLFDARFRTSFDRVTFAITGEDAFAAFNSAWGLNCVLS